MRRSRSVLSVATLTAVVAVAAPSLVAALPPAPGEPLPGSEHADAVVTVIDAGDPATAMVLRVSYTAGDVATYAQQWSDQGSETYHYDGTSSSSDWEMHVEREGIDEVLAAAADGSVRVRFAQQVSSQSLVYSNPDHGAGADYDASPLDGVAVVVDYGASRLSVAAYETPEQPLTDEQIAHLGGGPLALGVPTPAEAVGVGATWTWTAPLSLFGVTFDAAFEARLEAVDAERYTIVVEHDVDLTTAENLVLSDGIEAVTAGTMTGTRTVEGQIANPLDFEQTEEVVYSAVLELPDDVTYEAAGTTTASYTSTPADTAAPE